MVHGRQRPHLEPTIITKLVWVDVELATEKCTNILAAGLLTALYSIWAFISSDSFRSWCFCTIIHLSLLLSVKVALPERKDEES